jgi:hypothetical protein
MNIEDIRLRFVKECAWPVVSSRAYAVYRANTSPVRESGSKAREQAKDEAAGGVILGRTLRKPQFSSNRAVCVQACSIGAVRGGVLNR